MELALLQERQVFTFDLTSLNLNGLQNLLPVFLAVKLAFLLGYVLKEKMGFLAPEPIYAYPLAKQQALASNTKTYSATHNLLPQEVEECLECPELPYSTSTQFWSRNPFTPDSRNPFTLGVADALTADPYQDPYGRATKASPLTFSNLVEADTYDRRTDTFLEEEDRDSLRTDTFMEEEDRDSLRRDPSGDRPRGSYRRAGMLVKMGDTMQARSQQPFLPFLPWLPPANIWRKTT